MPPETAPGEHLRDDHAERQTVLDLQHVNHTVPDFVEELEEFQHLLLEHEVVGAEFRTWTVLGAEFDLAYNARRRIEERLPICERETFYPAVVDLLTDFQQAASRRM